jgi:hypothetical protein
VLSAVALLEGEVGTSLSSTGGILVGVERPRCNLKSRVDVIDSLSAPLRSWRIPGKAEVIYREMTWNRINRPIDVLIQYRHCGECALRRQPSSRKNDSVIRQFFLQVELADRQVARTVIRGAVCTLNGKDIPDIVR